MIASGLDTLERQARKQDPQPQAPSLHGSQTSIRGVGPHSGAKTDPTIKLILEMDPRLSLFVPIPACACVYSSRSTYTCSGGMSKSSKHCFLVTMG